VVVALQTAIDALPLQQRLAEARYMNVIEVQQPDRGLHAPAKRPKVEHVEHHCRCGN
jgi:hypothetical protein